LVRIDRDTGQPTLEKLVLVDDCGVVLNPMIVAGQVHGGVAQGLGEAFHEQMLYGDDGQPLTASLLDYAVPRASDMPPLILGETVTPDPFNPLGVKGVGGGGEGGCCCWDGARGGCARPRAPPSYLRSPGAPGGGVVWQRACVLSLHRASRA